MKTITLLLLTLISVSVFAQTKKAPVHGKVYGSKPDTAGIMDASKVESFMDRKTRISVVIRGKILKVTNPKGGWFTVDAGNGRTISAHFKNTGIDIPAGLAGRTVIMDGEAQKLFIADDKQHLAGDTAHGKKQSKVNADAKRRLSFEVRGMMVDK